MPADIWEIIELAGLAEKGSWPVLAGTLDQSYSFIQAMSFIRRDTNYWKSRRDA